MLFMKQMANLWVSSWHLFYKSLVFPYKQSQLSGLAIGVKINSWNPIFIILKY